MTGRSLDAILDAAVEPALRLPPGPRLMLVILARQATLAGDGYLSMGQIADRMGLSRKAAGAAFALLEDRGLVRRGPHRGPIPPTYHLKPAAMAEAAA